MVSEATAGSKLSQTRRPGTTEKPSPEFVPAESVPARVVLAMQGVTKSYPNGRVALRGVDLTIPEGDFVFLSGPPAPANRP